MKIVSDHADGETICKAGILLQEMNGNFNQVHHEYNFDLHSLICII